MFNKHLKNMNLSVQTELKPEKDYAYKPKVSDEVVLTVRSELESGKTLVQAAKDHGISTTTAHKIKHYHGCFGRGLLARQTT